MEYESLKELLEIMERMKAGSGDTISLPKSIYLLAKEIDKLVVKVDELRNVSQVLAKNDLS